MAAQQENIANVPAATAALASTDTVLVLIDGQLRQATPAQVAEIEFTVPNNSISTSNLVNGAVTTSKIADGAVTNEKLNDGSVSTEKIFDGAVTNSKIANGAVSASKIENNAVVTSNIANSAVTTAKIADRNVNAFKTTITYAVVGYGDRGAGNDLFAEYINPPTGAGFTFFTVRSPLSYQGIRLTGFPLGSYLVLATQLQNFGVGNVYEDASPVRGLRANATSSGIELIVLGSDGLPLAHTTNIFANTWAFNVMIIPF